MPEEFDSIFKSRKGGPPPWIDQLAADPAGRQLYYQLTSDHRNCLLLNYAVQKILNAGKGRCLHRRCDAVPPADLSCAASRRSSVRLAAVTIYHSVGEGTCLPPPGTLN